MQTFTAQPVVQGRDSIIIDAPPELVWPLIADSAQLEHWGPPVERVEVSLLEGQETESVGSRRKVFAKFSEKRRGWYQEVRTEHVDGRSITFLIYDDSFGMGKMLIDVGASMEIEPAGDRQTEFTFTFYHRPMNVMGRLMNPLIRSDQRRNRRKALQSIKQFAEAGEAIKN